jgi:hypothetical protein
VSLISVGEWCSAQLIGAALIVGISGFLDQSHHCAIEHIHLISLCTADTPFGVGSLYWLANNLMQLLRLDGVPPDELVVLSSPLPLVWAAYEWGSSSVPVAVTCTGGVTGTSSKRYLPVSQFLMDSVRAGSCCSQSPVIHEHMSCLVTVSFHVQW